MSVESITHQVKAEIAKLNQGLQLLEGGQRKTMVTTQMAGAPRRKLSASARKRNFYRSKSTMGQGQGREKIKAEL
jgi:hypothetical protein